MRGTRMFTTATAPKGYVGPVRLSVEERADGRVAHAAWLQVLARQAAGSDREVSAYAVALLRLEAERSVSCPRCGVACMVRADFLQATRSSGPVFLGFSAYCGSEGCQVSFKVGGFDV